MNHRLKECKIGSNNSSNNSSSSSSESDDNHEANECKHV